MADPIRPEPRSNKAAKRLRRLLAVARAKPSKVVVDRKKTQGRSRYLFAFVPRSVATIKFLKSLVFFFHAKVFQVNRHKRVIKQTRDA